MDQFHLKKGINMAVGYGEVDHYLDEKYIKLVKNAGFDHVRLPVSGKALEEGGEQLWDYMGQECERYLSFGLTPMLDMHGYYDINEEPRKQWENFLSLWERLAAYLSDMDNRVVFELLNEPGLALDYKLLNELQNEAIKRIRKTNPTRLLAAATTHANTIENLHHLELPENDLNIFVTIHDYTPMKFTHQGAGWMKGYERDGIVWGTPEERQYLEARYNLVTAWSQLNKRHIHLGEFGVLRAADISERTKWTEFMRNLCEERGFGWCYWEFWHGFGIYSKKKIGRAHV